MSFLFSRRRFFIVVALALIGAGALGLGHFPQALAKEFTDLGTSPVTPSVISHVAEAYVEPSRVRPAEQFEAALVALEKFIPEVLVDWKPGQQELLLRVDETVRHIRVPPLNTISDVIPVLRRVYRTVQAHMESDIESPRVEYVALNGLLQSLDPHSVLLAPELNKEFRLSAHGSFGGLGIVIGIRDGELTVIAPLEGTPAYRAGIKSKDKIVQIEDESTVNMDLIEAVSKLRGEPGTAITISIMRENLAEPKEVHIVRELIKIHAVEAYALGDGVGYVTIKNFQENTLRDLSEAVRNFRRKNSLRGLVLDLRNNPGGLFDQAVAVADKFIDEGTIVVTVGANRTDRRPSYARGWRTDTQVPMVVLINQGSASASEIVSGALKYRRRAMLVGSPTFGKGSVQQVFDIVGGSALKLSIAQYLLPGERSIQSVGVTPDLLLKPVELPSEDKDREVKFEAFHNGGKEKDLERSFSEWASQAEEPLFKLAYLKEREAEDAREVMELTNEEKANRARGDFAVQIAKRILLAAEGSSRQAVLETAAEVVPRAAKEEEARITSALSKIAIDWSRPEAELFRKPRPASAAPAVAELTFSPEEAEAGQEVTLSLAVTNRGPAPLFRVRALTEAELSLFKKREFILGRIGPGETHRWSLSFTLPKNVVARKEKVTAVVSDSQGPLGKAEGSITIMPLPRPGFSFSYKLFDNGQFGSHGNGDGLPQRQETIALRLAVTNKGPGASAKGLAVLKLERGLEGVFIEVGREEIKDLAPLETRTFDLLFRLKPDFEGGKLPVEVSVIDTVFREVLTAKVDLAKPLAVRRFSPPTIALAEGSTPLSLNRESFNLEGSVTDDGRVASVIVFTNQRKVLYKAGPTEGGSSLTFSTDMALKEGVNEVVVIAQDDQKLLSRQKVVILRGTVPAVARREGGEPVVGQ